jgi:hypothetical protein
MGPSPGLDSHGLPTAAFWDQLGWMPDPRQLESLVELQGHLSKGTLMSLRVAFSRAQEKKVYVQHRLKEDGGELWGLLERHAHFYICGGTSMGRDVVGALTGRGDLGGAVAYFCGSCSTRAMLFRRAIGASNL